MKVGWESQFGEILLEVDPELEKEVVVKVSISKDENFVDPVHEVEMTAPASLCNTLQWLLVC